jgi:pimeloyl-ACP methyl ester carboxylesterase
VPVETHYARAADGVHVAYQVTGEGPLDIVMVPGFVSNVEVAWDMPFIRPQLEGIGSFARLIRFDKRGTGLSDRGHGIPTLERRMEDVHAVMKPPARSGPHSGACPRVERCACCSPPRIPSGPPPSCS